MSLGFSHKGYTLDQTSNIPVLMRETPSLWLDAREANAWGARRGMAVLVL